MKRLSAIMISLALMFCLAAAYAETAPAEEAVRTPGLAARFASVEEGQALMRGRTLYHRQINEANLAFLLQKKGGTLDEYIEYAAAQVLAFTPEEEKRISGILDWLGQALERHGLELPPLEGLTFVRTTGNEDFGAAGYTSEGCVFLTEDAFVYFSEDELRDAVVHELFHCLSRQFPEFRQAMYSLIHFTVLEEDIDIPGELREQFVANPDVEHHNAVAEFTVNGEKKECYLLFMTDDVFENPGDTFFDGMYTGIVPLGGTELFRTENVPDFWDVVGRNTDYAEDPEEIMATNFSGALLNLDSGYGDFLNPEIPEGIIAYLRAGQ